MTNKIVLKFLFFFTPTRRGGELKAGKGRFLVRDRGTHVSYTLYNTACLLNNNISFLGRGSTRVSQCENDLIGRRGGLTGQIDAAADARVRTSRSHGRRRSTGGRTYVISRDTRPKTYPDNINTRPSSTCLVGRKMFTVTSRRRRRVCVGFASSETIRSGLVFGGTRAGRSRTIRQRIY